MNDDATGTGDEVPRGCPAYAADLSELALGVLTGRERARALSHVESCPHCAEELEQLSRAADAVVQVAPEVEPPLGFEVRLFERMGVADVEHRRRRGRPRRWMPAVLAAAAAVVALAVGLTLTLSSPPPPAQNAVGPGRHVAVATLVENGESVGHVVTHGGARPWMSMTLADSSARGTVHCIVVTKGGVTDLVGTFTAENGYGAWRAPLHVDPKELRTAEIVSPSGTVIATASLG
jgi:anti-sigma-K factor RskA